MARGCKRMYRNSGENILGHPMGLACGLLDVVRETASERGCASLAVARGNRMDAQLVGVVASCGEARAVGTVADADGPVAVAGVDPQHLAGFDVAFLDREITPMRNDIALAVGMNV